MFIGPFGKGNSVCKSRFKRASGWALKMRGCAIPNEILQEGPGFKSNILMDGDTVRFSPVCVFKKHEKLCKMRKCLLYTHESSAN